MTEGSRAVLDFLQKHPGREFTKHQIVEESDLTMAVVSATVNWLINKEFLEKRVEVNDSYGQRIEKLFVRMTQKGLAFDPEEEEKKKKQLRLEAAAARKEARLKERAERAKKNLIL